MYDILYKIIYNNNNNNNNNIANTINNIMFIKNIIKILTFY